MNSRWTVKGVLWPRRTGRRAGREKRGGLARCRLDGSTELFDTGVFKSFWSKFHSFRNRDGRTHREGKAPTSARALFPLAVASSPLAHVAEPGARAPGRFLVSGPRSTQLLKHLATIEAKGERQAGGWNCLSPALRGKKRVLFPTEPSSHTPPTTSSGASPGPRRAIQPPPPPCATFQIPGGGGLLRAASLLLTGGGFGISLGKGRPEPI